MRQSLMQKHHPPLLVPFNVRNQIINENGKGFDNNPDITRIKFSKQYEILTSYLKEKQIFAGINKRNSDILFKAKTSRPPVDYDEYRRGKPLINSYNAMSKILHNVKMALLYGHKSSILCCGFWGNMGDGAYRDDAFDDTDLKAYWKFEASATPVPNDSQSAADLGTAADLDMTGATHVAAGGIIGDSWDFDGVNDNGIAGSSLSQFNFLHNASYLATINLWYKKNSASPGGTRTLFGTARGANDIGFEIFLDDTAAQDFNIDIVRGSSPRVHEIITVTNQIPQDVNWHMITVRSDNGSTLMDFTLDGANGSVESSTTEGAAPSASNANAALRVGESIDAGFDYDGDLDETTVFNRYVSDSEITDLYNAGSGLEIY